VGARGDDADNVVVIRGRERLASSGNPVMSATLVESSAAAAALVARASTDALTQRIAAIDRLRGLVIVLMALDHVRDYFSIAHFSPTDLTKTTLALFATRWVTHLCAPIFIFLAGLSVSLRTRRDTPAQLSRFLATRGLWMIVLEVTIVRFGWGFTLDYSLGFFLQVIWAIGVSMLALAALVHLSRRTVGVIAIVILAGHNLLDGISAESFGAFASLWRVLHEQGPFTLGFVAYPVLPWVGVIALGFACGGLYEIDAPQRRRALLRSGWGALIAFGVLRAINLYGDPSPWTVQPDVVFTVLSFFNVTKYPPSLLYVLVTLGVMALLLARLERSDGRIAGVLETYGRVPLFAYVVHVYVLHLFAGLLAMTQGYGTSVLTQFFFFLPKDWGYSLPVVYAAWLVVLAVLYPACAWFGALKQRRRDWWLSYL
jgi:uncharacterized membrane protein